MVRVITVVSVRALAGRIRSSEPSSDLEEWLRWNPQQLAVRAARFRYDNGPGDRGLGSPRAGRKGLADDYIDTEDRETLVGVTIETETDVKNLDAILDVPELGFVFIGPFDLSVSLGCPGEIDHPNVQEDRRSVPVRPLIAA